MSTSNKNEKIYSVAKKSSMAEAILTCNWILGFEVYGISEKKQGFVTFGILYRVFGIVSHVLVLIAIFGFGFLEWYMNIKYLLYSDPLAAHGPIINIYNIKTMKIVIGVILGLSIAYNMFFKIRYQMKVKNLMKEEENSLPMTQAYPQTYPQAYPQAYP